MRKNIILATLIAILLVSSVMLTGCGDAVRGTWYYINDASEASYYNFEFQSDHVVVNEGVSGRYELDGDNVNVDFFGIKRTYEITEFEGETVLVENGCAKWARTLDGAKKLKGSD